MAKKQELADLKAQIATEDDAASQKGVSDADKAAHKANIDKLQKQADAAEDAVDPMQKDFITAAKTAAGKASSDVKTKFGGAFVNLRQAVDDAEISNGAAAVRYPFAAPGIKDAVQKQVSFIVADIIEEKTGKRPSLAGLQPGVTLDGLTPSVTLNGLSKDDLGKLTVGDVTSETVTRTKAWVGHALGLLGDISKTKEILGFEEKVLDAVLDGFKSGGWTAPAAAAIDANASGGAKAPGAPGVPSAPKLPGL